MPTLLPADTIEETLPFGDELRAVRLPARARVVSAGWGTRLRPLPDLEAALRAALARPLGLAPLGALVRPGARVTIAFDDPTVPSYGPLRRTAITLVLEALASAGVAEERVTLVCANSLHRKWTIEELVSILGDELVGRFAPAGRLVCHDAEDPEGLLHLGVTSPGGFDVEVSRLVTEADLCVYVNAQCLRGFMGGWKSVCVGLSTHRSIRWHHTPDGMSMSVKDNRMHRVLDEMGALLEARLGRRIFKIETVLANPFEAAHVFAGGVPETRRAALDVLEGQHPPRRAAAPPADVVVYGVPAWSPYAMFAKMNPLLTLLSSGLGYLGGVIEALGKPGCSVVLATPCRDEWDDRHHPSYREVWERVLPVTRDPWEISRRFEDEFARRPDYVARYRHGFGFHGVHGIYATHPLKRLRHAGRVYVAGAEVPALAEHVGFVPAAGVEDAVARAERDHGADCAITFVRQLPAA
ncbi:MAG TPA: lactate racemase domain-containing protein [Myxococcota bacterium]|jgi:hypothetical protein|nr:lactate racemase domain-containing protein [Myxococcota bacterium]